MFNAAANTHYVGGLLRGKPPGAGSAYSQVAHLPNAAAALLKRTPGLMTTEGSFMILGASSIMKGSSKKPKQQGAI